MKVIQYDSFGSDLVLAQYTGPTQMPPTMMPPAPAPQAGLSTGRIVMYGLLAVGAYLLYRKLKKPSTVSHPASE